MEASTDFAAREGFANRPRQDGERARESRHEHQSAPHPRTPSTSGTARDGPTLSKASCHFGDNSVTHHSRFANGGRKPRSTNDLDQFSDWLILVQNRDRSPGVIFERQI
ncbi:unnamed protein product [Tuwongella immobilis]|uniref:Uncharacterized protein n=1 Tax=Tuwongella immobilis TaxID=692036 RepID=A0A6C2YXM5_9BACT|nr:unnamed protein product [Tuwongella immobilis]VTS08594.1 unnamed protein product [Tuwongella immobilis]